MFKEDIVKDSHFQEIAEVKLDAKSRITLAKAKNSQTKTYKVYRNSIGQIILDPQVSIPAHEQWIYDNPKVYQSIKKGLLQAKSTKITKAGKIGAFLENL